jgi:CIC family chloride channel protein
MDARNKFFRRLPIPELFKPALGGFLLGCIALVFPQVLGGGYEWLPRLVEDKLPFYLILILIVPKMIATACTISSGGSGGLLAPSIFIGGLVGGTLGHLSQIVFTYLGVPQWAPDIATSVLVGMATFFAGVGKLPFAAAIIVCELAGFHYTFLIPLIVLNLLHIAIQSPSTSIYEEQVLAPIDSEAHFGSYSIDLLQVLKVQEAFSKENGVTILSTSSIPETVKLIAPLPDTLFPVLDDQGKFVGVLYATDVWGAFQHRNKWKDRTVWDLMRQTPTTISPKGNLYNAMRICLLEGISEIPVIDPKQPDVLLGMLRHSDIIAAYNERLAAAQWT